jgi:hypothetical protein
MLRNKDDLIERLKRKPVPRAVRWLDPGVLVSSGVRVALSAVFGEYADQRLMQAATDSFGSNADLIERYDYSSGAKREEVFGASDACWVDYIADVGAGFGPTFGMASLLAREELSLSNLPGQRLPAGGILIMGGDQCYPMGTHEEYQERLVLPYATALPFRDRDAPHRHLFALPGNHDWFDGLGAFDSLLCQSRGQLSKEKPDGGRRIGGWRCQQHRSYWAIRLPHNWWLWGVDIQFSKYLDDAQEEYFDAVVNSIMRGEHGMGDHNVVLCIAEPHWWLDPEFADPTV